MGADIVYEILFGKAHAGKKQGKSRARAPKMVLHNGVHWGKIEKVYVAVNGVNSIILYAGKGES